MDDTNWMPIVLPELGAGEDPIRVSTWLVEVEEPIETGERLVDVCIPGIAFSVSSPVSGRLVKIELPADSPIKPGDTLGWVETDSESISE